MLQPVCCGKHMVFDAARSRHDPTGTMPITKKWEAELVRRLRLFRALIFNTVVELDVLGLKTPEGAIRAAASGLAGDRRIVADAAPLPPRRGFAFNRPAEKSAAFIDWLYEQQQAGVLGVIPGQSRSVAASNSWQNLYIDSSYRRGMESAAAELGVKSSLISSFTGPFHADRVGLIYTRAYNELEGINDAMSQQISRVLAQGLADGYGADQMARELAAVVDGMGITRARTMARTEMISAFSEATLNTFEEANVGSVTVMAEFSTAGDDAVCPECDELEGKEFEIEEARGMIPVHPNCRCAFLPVIDTGA